MKLSKYAQLMGVSYQTAWQWCKNDMIQYEAKQVLPRVYQIHLKLPATK